MDKLQNLDVTDKYIGMVQEVDELRYACLTPSSNSS